MKDLLAAAEAARAHAHAPYSRFKVGAALRAADGRIFAGCNVENAAYPQTQCAEAAAIGALVAAGGGSITEALVLGEGDTPCTPCGGCRQRLAELAAPEVRVWVCSPAATLMETTVGALLPYGFTLGPGRAVLVSRTALEVIEAAVPGFVPRLALVLGSGLGGIGDAIERIASLSYADLPGFPRPGVAGHAGELVLGRLAGVPVACLAGRAHLYEDPPAASLTTPIRTLRQLGARALVLTNAAGSLRPEVGPGSLVLLSDHLNLMGRSPLVGANDEAIGPRFPDMTDAYDPKLRAVIHRQAAHLGTHVEEGVYAGWLGPAFETPAEIRMLRVLGADLVGMSTVPEALVARHCGLRVLAISVVTNLAAGMAGHPLSHEETLRETGRAADKLTALLLAAVEGIDRECA